LSGIRIIGLKGAIGFVCPIASRVRVGIQRLRHQRIRWLATRTLLGGFSIGSSGLRQGLSDLLERFAGSGLGCCLSLSIG
jgi:hypothetical protein